MSRGAHSVKSVCVAPTAIGMSSGARRTIFGQVRPLIDVHIYLYVYAGASCWSAVNVARARVTCLGCCVVQFASQCAFLCVQSFEIGKLSATVRSEIETGSKQSRKLREEGKVPSILYGFDNDGIEGASRGFSRVVACCGPAQLVNCHF